jgi:(S)-ureidoglycine aminohydrolase
MTTKFEMHVTTLNEKLSSHAPHTHPEEEIVLMLSGQARMDINGVEYDASPGDIIFLTSQVSHAIRNSGNGDCEYFAFQWK